MHTGVFVRIGRTELREVARDVAREVENSDTKTSREVVMKLF